MWRPRGLPAETRSTENSAAFIDDSSTLSGAVSFAVSSGLLVACRIHDERCRLGEFITSDALMPSFALEE